jgi:hypothetical protein
MATSTKPKRIIRKNGQIWLAKKSSNSVWPAILKGSFYRIIEIDNWSMKLEPVTPVTSGKKRKKGSFQAAGTRRPTRVSRSYIRPGHWEFIGDDESFNEPRPWVVRCTGCNSHRVVVSNVPIAPTEVCKWCENIDAGLF